MVLKRMAVKRLGLHAQDSRPEVRDGQLAVAKTAPPTLLTMPGSESSIIKTKKYTRVVFSRDAKS